MFEIDHWKVETQYSADEIGALFIDIDPRALGNEVSYQTIEPIRRRIEADYSRAREAVHMLCIFHDEDQEPLSQAIKDLSNKSGMGLFSVELLNQMANLEIFFTANDVNEWISSKNSHIDNQKFSKEEIQKWLLGEGLKSKFDFSADSIVDPIFCGSKSKWPWGNYTTKDLEILAAAAAEFWGDYKPENPVAAPKIEVVKAWLMTNHNVAEERAYYMASILRADEVPAGPRPSRKRG